jgi:GT2 family glycosyltransferase
MLDRKLEPALSVVIVNWNSGALLRRCLVSLREALANAQQDYEIIVVDNASQDDSLNACADIGNVVVVQTGDNMGFGRACNAGAREAHGRNLIFLNPDCEIRPGSVERCLAELRQPEVGVCGMSLVDERGTVWRTCHRFPSFVNFLYRIFGFHVLFNRLGDGAMTSWDHSQDADVDHVIGAFYGMRRDVFQSVGGFDERFFLYLEDLDLSLRVRRAGYRVRFLAAPASFHVGGGVSRTVKARRVFYATRSRIVYAYKHFPRWQANIHLGLTLVVEPVPRIALAIGHGSLQELKETYQAFALIWSDLPAILRLASR